MAPRPPESREAFVARLRRVGHLQDVQLRFGQHHHSHAVCRSGGGPWTVRRLELDMQVAEAYRREHGHFMPENAEMLSQPGAVVLEADTLEQLIAALEQRPWPFA